MTTATAPTNPWEKWGWAFAAIWLVFLIYPVIAVAEADVATAVKIAGFACIVGFAVANVLGYGRRGNPWLFLAVMVGFALATLPVIGIGVISYTPYLAMLSALALPAPAWKWRWASGPPRRWSRCSTSTASRPTSS